MLVSVNDRDKPVLLAFITRRRVCKIIIIIILKKLIQINEIQIIFREKTKGTVKKIYV